MSGSRDPSRDLADDDEPHARGAIAGSTALRLYVAGDAPNSVAAKRNLDAFLARYPEHQVALEVIDVLLDPERALAAGVLVTPLLVRVAPAPERRVVGNLEDEAALLASLGFGECR